jgi:hypothetical protein
VNAINTCDNSADSGGDSVAMRRPYAPKDRLTTSAAPSCRTEGECFVCVLDAVRVGPTSRDHTASSTQTRGRDQAICVAGS